MMKFKNISKTLFIPFYFKYKESIGKKYIYDKEAINFFSNNHNLQILNFAEIEKDIYSQIGVISRTTITDNYLKNLLENNIDNIFNIGCGLDFRNRRLNITKSWFNIDLTEVIQFREKNFGIFKSEKNISENVLNSKNWDFIPNEINIFILEGVVMYFSEEQISNLILNLTSKSKKSYFIIETSPEEMLTTKHQAVNSIDNNITFKSGTNNINEFAKKLDLNLLQTTQHCNIYQERWPIDNSNSELVKNLKNNFRVSLFEKN